MKYKLLIKILVKKQLLRLLPLKKVHSGLEIKKVQY